MPLIIENLPEAIRTTKQQLRAALPEYKEVFREVEAEMRRREVEEDNEDGKQRPDAGEGRELWLAHTNLWSWGRNRFGDCRLKLLYFRFEEGGGHSFIRGTKMVSRESGNQSSGEFNGSDLHTYHAVGLDAAECWLRL